MKKYVFKDYSNLFPSLFDAESTRISSYIDNILTIEHIGSTAVPGLGGKGIIDLAVAAKKNDFEIISKMLQQLGYTFRPSFSTDERLYFIIDLPDSEEGTRRYHLHLTYPESNEWKEFIEFRDFLISNPNKAAEYAEIKKNAANIANQDGRIYRKLKERFFKDCGVSKKMKFKKATLHEKNIVSQWLQEPHVKEFWDNSPEHFQDILIFMQGRKVPSPYWDGIFDYWIGYIDNISYCLVMTSEILPTPDLSELWKAHLSRKGKTLSIDFMIGNTQFLGQGLGSLTLDAFTHFIHNDIDLLVDTFFIDPAETNPRAKRVYEKAGFKTVDSFIRDEKKFFLMIKTLCG